ncbi:MAG: hypothetical protein HKN33_02255 [Pyrinomonadaceae bacterium]|nr:hypothetical protein [Pyrinomonadaceae bacterium]
MPKVFASITELESLKGGNKELYVITLSTDGRGEDKHESDIVSAHNERITRIAPEIVELDALKWMIASVSNIFERVKPGSPALILGDGIILYPELDPKGLLGMHVAVMESDSGHRELGLRLKKVLESSEVKGVVKQLTGSGAPTAELVGDLMRTVTDAFLAKNKDDVLLTFGYSGRESTNYGIGIDIDPTRPVKDFPFQNDLIKGNLRVMLV